MYVLQVGGPTAYFKKTNTCSHNNAVKKAPTFVKATLRLLTGGPVDTLRTLNRCHRTHGGTKSPGETAEIDLTFGPRHAVVFIDHNQTSVASVT